DSTATADTPGGNSKDKSANGERSLKAQGANAKRQRTFEPIGKRSPRHRAPTRNHFPRASVLGPRRRKRKQRDGQASTSWALRARPQLKTRRPSAGLEAGLMVRGYFDSSLRSRSSRGRSI